MNNDPNWRVVYGRKSPRLRDQELVLRVLAFYSVGPTYRRPLKTFLNNFASEHRHLQRLNHEELESLFREASELMASAEGRQAVRYQSSQVNAALAEALFVGLIRRLSFRKDVEAEDVRQAISDIQGNRDIQLAISRSTANEESVKTRLEVAAKRFAAI